MLTPRRKAQLGLGAAGLVLLCSVKVLLSGEVDAAGSAEVAAAAQATATVPTPLVISPVPDRVSAARP